MLNKARQTYEIRKQPEEIIEIKGGSLTIEKN